MNLNPNKGKTMTEKTSIFDDMVGKTIKSCYHDKSDNHDSLVIHFTDGTKKNIFTNGGENPDNETWSILF